MIWRGAITKGKSYSTVLQIHCRDMIELLEVRLPLNTQVNANGYLLIYCRHLCP